MAEKKKPSKAKQSNSRKKKNKYVYTIGRRKKASAQVRLFKGRGINTVNGLPAKDYFPGQNNKVLFEKPFQVTGTLGKFYATALVKGSGKMSQLEAVVHGISRALNEVD